MQKELDVISSEGKFLRFIRASKRRGYLAQLREDLNDTANAFIVSNMTFIHIKITHIVSNAFGYCEWHNLIDFTAL